MQLKKKIIAISVLLSLLVISPLSEARPRPDKCPSVGALIAEGFDSVSYNDHAWWGEKPYSSYDTDHNGWQFIVRNKEKVHSLYEANQKAYAGLRSLYFLSEDIYNEDLFICNYEGSNGVTADAVCDSEKCQIR